MKPKPEATKAMQSNFTYITTPEGKRVSLSYAIYTDYYGKSKGLRELLEWKTGAEYEKLARWWKYFSLITGLPVGKHMWSRLFACQLIPDLLHKLILEDCPAARERLDRIIELDKAFHFVTTINYKDGEPVYTSVPRIELKLLTA